MNSAFIISLIMIHIYRGCCSQVFPTITAGNFYELFTKVTNVRNVRLLCRHHTTINK